MSTYNEVSDLTMLRAVVAGYVSTRLYASLGGQAWKQNMMGTAVLFPTVLFATLNLLNFFLIGANSSGAVPFGTFVSIILLWFGIAVPLTVGGSVYGIKQGSWSHPVRVNQIPRRESDSFEQAIHTICDEYVDFAEIPPQIWYLKTIPAALMAGVLPFGAAFIEIYFVLSSMFG